MHLQVELAVQTLDWSELAQKFQSWSQADLLYPEPLMAAVHAIANAETRTDAADIEQLEMGLMGVQQETRRLALAALTFVATLYGGWTPERLNRLYAFRKDPALLVASAAQFTLPEAEISFSYGD